MSPKLAAVQLRNGFRRRGILRPLALLRSGGAPDDRFQFSRRIVEVVVDDQVVEVVLGAELLFGDLEAFVDRIGGIGAAADESVAQDGLVGRCDEDLDRVGT